MNKPVIAIVGRPNVGKSALFNRLARRRLSIVESTPGVTRDRVYADCDIYGRRCALVDTGGLDPTEKEGLVSQVAMQVQVALREAALILFVVDGREALTATDYAVADLLRHTRKPVLLVANKLDRGETAPEDLFGLRLGEAVGISALHGLRMDRVVDWIAAHLPESAEETVEEDDSLKIAIVGRPNVGKSALLNALIGQERTIVSPTPGTTRDAIDTPWEWQGQRVTLIDTAGMRKRGKVKLALEYYSVLRSLRAIERADVVLLVMDHRGPTEQDAKIGGYAHEAGKAIVVVCNKWDLVSAAAKSSPSAARLTRQEKLLRSDYERLVRTHLKFMHYAPVVPTSALFHYGLSSLMESAIRCHQQNTQRVPTGRLNRLIQEAVQAKPPPMHKGKAVRIYYATQVAVAPPTFVLFANDDRPLHFSYLRYLENQLRKEFDFAGTPICLIVRERKREG
jgi:GTP-binding protein